MGGHYWFNLFAPLRDDTPDAEFEVLERWAKGEDPSEEQLAAIRDEVNDVVRWAPVSGSQYGRMHGTPMSLFRHRGTWLMSVTLIMQEDDFANGGWQFLWWLLDLVDRSFDGPVGTMWHDEGGEAELLVHMHRKDGSTLARVFVDDKWNADEKKREFFVRDTTLTPSDSFVTEILDYRRMMDEWKREWERTNRPHDDSAN